MLHYFSRKGSIEFNGLAEEYVLSDVHTAMAATGVIITATRIRTDRVCAARWFKSNTVKQRDVTCIRLTLLLLGPQRPGRPYGRFAT